MPTESEPGPRPHLPRVTEQESFALCQRLVRQSLGGYSWAGGNLARDTRRELCTILAAMLQSARVCDIHIGQAARLDLLNEIRTEYRDNIMGDEQSGIFPALLATTEKYQIPRQYILDMIQAGDLCSRLEHFTTFDHWLQLSCRLGGACMVACAHVLGIQKPGFEPAALGCGQAIHLTHLLGSICNEIQKLEFFMPREDVQAFEIDLSKHNPQRPEKNMLRLIRLQVSRIEQRFEEGGKLVSFLELDGQRVVTTLVSLFWNQLMTIKRYPETILEQPLALSRKERFRFRLKHVLGLEGGVAVLPQQSDKHHA